YMLTVVAVFGTTISPYLFYWQASQEAEESRLSFSRDHVAYRIGKTTAFRAIIFDTWVGMIVSNLISWFILVTTAATLHVHGIVNIQTAAQAAEALRPIAGALTFGLFAAGIIGTGLLAVPVLAGSAAYAVAEAFRLQGSLELPASRAIGFYTIIASATLGGLMLVAVGLDPIKMLFWAAVINGIVSVPIMVATMLTATAHHRKRPHPAALELPRWLVVLGWLAALLMGLSVIGLAWQSWG
ncbi:MAG: divalent metal cation transporter, partial [Alphaproteobacteria bacterium]|nr:divalent metal cation transporter [Alphaproteobacteria bacterium]